MTPGKARGALLLLVGEDDNIESPQWEPLSDVEEQVPSETSSQPPSELPVLPNGRRRRKRKRKRVPLRLSEHRSGHRKVRLDDEDALESGEEEVSVSTKEMKKEEEASTDDSVQNNSNIIRW